MKRWYLLYCKRGEQLRAQQHLENQNVECYFPSVVVEKITRGKQQKKQEPLFPGYVFIRFDYEQGPSFTTVRSTRGVVDFVRQGPHPQELQGDLVYMLKQREQSTTGNETTSLPEKGQVLRVQSGQFAGVDAIYDEADGDTRSIMLVKMLSHTVSMSIENKDIEL